MRGLPLMIILTTLLWGCRTPGDRRSDSATSRMPLDVYRDANKPSRPYREIALLSREGKAKRLNAGSHAKTSRVPKRRPMSHSTLHHSAVPSGLVCLTGDFPALKRRAILNMSLRDKGRRRPDYQPITQLNSLAVPSRAYP